MASQPGQNIRYDIYTEADADELTTLLGEVFAHRDPPAIAAGLTPQEFETFVRLLCPQAQTDGLTIVARSAESGEMLGAMLNEDSASPLPEGLDGLGPKFEPILDILGQLDAEYEPARTFARGESMHLFLLGVASHCAGQGVAQRLVAESLAHGARRGYRLAVTEATNKISQHIFRKHGFVERVRGSYADHRYRGRQVFASIAEHGGPALMDKQLG